METILSLCIGIGLSAACGFRVFVPLLVMSIASLMGWFEPMKGFEWLAMPSVCIGLAVATLCEIGAYYIPWVDNILDTIATPAALIAGTLTMKYEAFTDIEFNPEKSINCQAYSIAMFVSLSKRNLLGKIRDPKEFLKFYSDFQISNAYMNTRNSSGTGSLF